MARLLDAVTKARVAPVPRQCWWNALRAAKLLSRRKGIVVRYVEGYAVMSCFPIPISHGWIEMDGETVEVTTDELFAAYFPGVRYDPKTTRSRQTMPIAEFHHRTPEVMAAMAEAMIAAHAHAFGQPVEAMRRFMGGGAMLEA